LANIKSYHSGSTFVPSLSPTKSEIIHIPSPGNITEVLPPSVQSHHTRQDDDAMIAAKSTLLIASAYIIAAAMITLGLMIIIFMFRGLGEGAALYFFTGIIVWGVCILLALFGNRRQSLHHSSSGLGHAEIQSRERLAKYVVDQHAAMLMRRWEIDSRER